MAMRTKVARSLAWLLLWCVYVTAVALAAAALSAAVPTVAAVPEAHAQDPPPAAREPMLTEVRTIDGVNVLFQYGQPVPAFDTWQRTEPGRERRALDGDWKFAFDPNDSGLTERWQAPAFDDSAWRTVQVPSSWDLYDTPNFGSYDGSAYGVGTAFVDGYAWFRTRVRPPSHWDRRFVRLTFLAVNYRAWVYVNGTFVGEHEGGHTPFALDVSAHLRSDRDNVIAVRVYRRPWYDTYTGTPQTPIVADTEVPYKPVDYWPYAGMTRSVFLEATPQVTVTKLLTAARDGMLQIHAVVHNHGTRPAWRLVLLQPGAGTGGAIATAIVALAPGQVRVVSRTIAIPGARPWDLATPQLYRASASLHVGFGAGQEQAVVGSLDDRLSADYGMRSIDVADGKLLLNGRPVFLKGLNWHEETAASGRSLTIDEYDRELQIVRDAGANFIRNSVYTRHPYVYDYADRHGLLVMDDIDNMWLNRRQEQLQTESYGLSRALALTMAWNQANHPSVMLWCLQNESEIGSDASVYRAWLEDMKRAVQSLDLQDRPVTWASSSSNDPAFDLADVIGFNEYFGYFYGRDLDLGSTLDTVHQRYPGKPILITENGTWSILGQHGSEGTGGTEEWQSAKFQLHWNQTVLRQQFVAGYVFWLLKDYKQRMNYNHQYNGISTMGLIAFDGQRKLVYDTFRAAPFLSAATIPSSQMTATATSGHVGYEASQAIDGRESTMWHSEWSPYAPLPQAITVSLGGRYNVRALRYLGRQDGNPNGRILTYRVLVSDDGVTFTEVSAGTWTNDPGFKFASLSAAAAASYVRLEAVAGSGNLAAAAEIAIEYEP